MSYTFQPLVDIEYTSHTGFFMLLVVAITIVTFQFLSWRDGQLSGKTLIFAILASLGVLWFVHDNSYNTPEKIANVQVVGTFVGFSNEAIVNKSGKSSISVEHATYVTYKIDGGYITLSARPNQKYPEKAVLYRN